MVNKYWVEEGVEWLGFGKRFGRNTIRRLVLKLFFNMKVSIKSMEYEDKCCFLWAQATSLADG